MPEPKDKVTVWEAFDGKEFNSESEAQRYEDKHWEKVQGNFRAINEMFQFQNYEHVGILDECSSIWSDYEGHEPWPSDKKKEGFEFIRTLYLIHKSFEEESKKGNTKYLNLDLDFD